MKVRAPGKIVLSGAYAVLEGAPALVLAVDRYAIADSERPTESPSAEVRQALGAVAPSCDVSALHVPDGSKLGLGSSAAALVASLGAVLAASGEAIEGASSRSRIFERARAAHSAVQGGGSGVDVAASTYGGVLRYAVAPEPSITHVELPAELVWRAYFSGRSAKTSDLRARVEAFRASSPATFRERLSELGQAAESAAHAVSGSAAGLVERIRTFGESLARLGDAADIPIVPSDFRSLSAAAAAEGGAFLPAGAGGGDVGIFCAARAPSEEWGRLASGLSMTALSLSIAPFGVYRFPS